MPSRRYSNSSEPLTENGSTAIEDGSVGTVERARTRATTATPTRQAMAIAAALRRRTRRAAAVTAAARARWWARAARVAWSPSERRSRAAEARDDSSSPRATGTV